MRNAAQVDEAAANRPPRFFRHGISNQFSQPPRNRLYALSPHEVPIRKTPQRLARCLRMQSMGHHAYQDHPAHCIFINRLILPVRAGFQFCVAFGPSKWTIAVLHYQSHTWVLAKTIFS
jgi:hypothetical protein